MGSLHSLAFQGPRDFSSNLSLTYEFESCCMSTVNAELELNFQLMVSRLAKDPEMIIESINHMKVDLWHGATGVATEAGELLDAVKKHAIYDKRVDCENIIEELGDLEFYMEMVRSSLDISREDTLRHVRQKLGKRYAEGYSDQAAQQRADKTEETEVSGIAE